MPEPTQEYLKLILELRDWIKDSPYTQKTFAEQIGCSTHHALDRKIYQRSGVLNPFTPDEAEGIERVTKGQFLAAQFLNHLTPPGYELVRKEPPTSHVVSVGDLVVDREVA